MDATQQAQLVLLQQLHAQGILTDEQYQAQVVALTGGGDYYEALTVQGDFVQGDQIKVTGDHNTIILDPATAPPDALRRAYYRALAAECRHLPLGVVDPRFAAPGPEGEVGLDAVYVDLDVVAPVREPAEGLHEWGLRLARGAGEQRTPLLEALAAPAAGRVVLLGDPGSGKTTFVNYVTYRLARAAAEEEGPPDLPAPLRALWPVRLVLRDVAAGLTAAGGCGPAEQLWTALRADIAARLGPLAADRLWPHLQQHLLRQGGLFLLDGLDEVPEAGQRRAVLLQAVQALLACLPAGARLVLTARPYAYADSAWQLPGLPILALAPFSEAQAQRFVARWSQAARLALGWSAAEATARAGQLTRALAERPYLADLASRPLLLTLMATLHSSWGQLPEDRADLYEESVKLLLARWQRGRQVTGPDGRPVLEPGIEKVLGLGEERLRAVVEQLALETHIRQGTEPGRAEALADIPQAAVLAAFAPRLPADLNPTAVLSYLETRAGLLLGRREGVYAFPHRSFQEYLAACALLNRGEGVTQLRDRCRADPAWWREVCLLGVGKKRQGGLADAVALVNTLLPVELADVPEPTATDWQLAALAGQALLELRFPARAAGEPVFTALLRRVQRWLAALVEQGPLPVKERAAAGDVLGTLGDPRPGVGVVGARQAAPLPDMDWVAIPAGPFLLGSPPGEPETNDDEYPQHKVDLPLFYISRYLITNAQFRPFVEGDGYTNPAYWTPAGWAWRQGAEADLTPLEGLDAAIIQAYREWLAQRPVEQRDRPRWWDDPTWGAPNRPVVGVTWYEAAAYCRWLEGQLQVAGSKLQVECAGQRVALNLQPGTFNLQLPSEAEWEKAARGGLTLPVPGEAGQLVPNPCPGRRYPWGPAWQEDCANTQEAGLEQTSAVGLFPAGASPYGVLDLVGNVWEWTRSRWGRNVARPDFRYPYGPGDGREDPESAAVPVLRGGSWFDDRRNARCAYRDGVLPVYDGNDIGLRVVLSLVNSDF